MVSKLGMTKLDNALDKLKQATPVQKEEVAEAILFLLDGDDFGLADEGAEEVRRRLGSDGVVVAHDDVFAWLSTRRK
jgi:hypothetical protein